MFIAVPIFDALPDTTEAAGDMFGILAGMSDDPCRHDDTRHAFREDTGRSVSGNQSHALIRWHESSTRGRVSERYRSEILRPILNQSPFLIFFCFRWWPVCETCVRAPPFRGGERARTLAHFTVHAHCARTHARQESRCYAVSGYLDGMCAHASRTCTHGSAG